MCCSSTFSTKADPDVGDELIFHSSCQGQNKTMNLRITSKNDNGRYECIVEDVYGSPPPRSPVDEKIFVRLETDDESIDDAIEQDDDGREYVKVYVDKDNRYKPEFYIIKRTKNTEETMRQCIGSLFTVW